MVFAGQQPAGEGAPDQHAQPLVDRDRQQFIFGLACLQRVVDLLGDEALLVTAVADREPLHHLPAGPVGAADITHLALADQSVERGDRFLDRGKAVPLVDEINVDDIGLQPLQALFALTDQMVARQAFVVRPAADPHARFGGDQQVVLALAAERLADDLLRQAVRIDIGGVDEVDAGVDARVDHPLGFGKIAVADRCERACAAEGHGAQSQCRNLQAGTAKGAVFHVGPRDCVELGRRERAARNATGDL